MKFNPKVTVIIPAYNAESFIERGINSVLNQTYKNVELIIVDDGSTDNTSSLIEKKFGSSNNIKLFRQNNSGVSVARNKGIELATGDYCIFLDADDWLEENCIETLVNYSEQYNIFTICDRFLVRKINDEFIKKDLSKTNFNGKFNIPYVIINYLKFQLQSACHKLFNLDLIKKYNILFPVGISHGEDGLFVFRYLQNIDQLMYIPKPLWNVLRNPKSASHSGFNSSMLSGIKAVELMIKENNKYNIPDVNEALNQYLLYRTVNFANLSLLSSKTTQLDRLFLKRKLKKCLKHSFIQNNYSLSEILALVNIFMPKLFVIYIKLRRKIDKLKNYK